MLSCYMEQDVLGQIREILTEARNEWKLKELAEKAGINPTTLSLIKNDMNRGINLYTAEQILKAKGKHLVIVDDE